MMKPTYTIAIAAIFMVAAFAGIAMVDDEADAAEAPVTSVAYKIGTGSDSFETFTFEVSGESFIVKDITDFDVEVKGIFEKWTAGSVSYEPGATVTLSGLVAEGGVLTLTASVTGADVVSFIADGKVIEGGSLTPEAEKVTAPAVPEKDCRCPTRRRTDRRQRSRSAQDRRSRGRKGGEGVDDAWRYLVQKSFLPALLRPAKI